MLGNTRWTCMTMCNEDGICIWIVPGSMFRKDICEFNTISCWFPLWPYMGRSYRYNHLYHLCIPNLNVVFICLLTSYFVGDNLTGTTVTSVAVEINCATSCGTTNTPHVTVMAPYDNTSCSLSYSARDVARHLHSWQLSSQRAISDGGKVPRFVSIGAIETVMLDIDAIDLVSI